MKKVSILLIEDAPTDIRLIQQAIEGCGIPVDLTVAQDGEKAVALLAKNEIQPDLVILDLHIPKVSGLSLLEHQLKKSIPVVVFSSSWGDSEIQQALALGAREFVHKPMGGPGFTNAVCGMIRKWAVGERNISPTAKRAG